MATAETLDDLASYAREGSFAGLRTARIELLHAPARAALDAPFEVHWRTQGAVQVRMRLRGALQGEREVPPQGALMLRSQVPGTTAIDLVCSAGDAETGAPDVVATAMVIVVTPPAELSLSTHQLTGLPGGSVRLFWSSSHASRVVLHRAMQGIELELPLRGAVDLCIDALTDEVLLTSHGLDGAPGARHTCHLIPQLPTTASRQAGPSTWFSKPLEELSSWI